MPTLRHFYDGFIEFFYKQVKVIVVHRLGGTWVERGCNVWCNVFADVAPCMSPVFMGFPGL